MIGDVLLVRACAEVLAERIRPYQPDILMAIEAKGLSLVYQVASLLGMERYVVVRKGPKPKLYMVDSLIVEETSITTAGVQKFVLDGREAERLRGKRVAVADDVVSTQGTMDAACELVRLAGGEVVCRACVLREGNEERPGEQLTYLGWLPLFEHAPGGGWRPKR